VKNAVIKRKQSLSRLGSSHLL